MLLKNTKLRDKEKNRRKPLNTMVTAIFSFRNCQRRDYKMLDSWF